jgi:hypothetical protein
VLEPRRTTWKVLEPQERTENMNEDRRSNRNVRESHGSIVMRKGKDKSCDVGSHVLVMV